MSKLEKLMQQYCPDGVEWIKIKDIAQVGTGSSNGNEADEDGKYPFFVRSQIVKSKNDFEYDEEAIIIPGEGGIGDIFHYINGKYALHQRVYRIHFTTQQINVKFAFYYMKSAFKRFIMTKAVSATVTSIRKPMIEDFEIPVPPLPVQEEIVRILDTFTELQAELQAELQKRKQQYNYYLDNLLSFKNINRGGQTEVKWMQMSEVMSISRGASPRPIQNYLTDADDGIPWIKIGDVSPSSKYISSTKEKIKKEGATKSRYLKKGDFILSNSMSFGRPYILNIDGCIHDGWISMYGFEEHLDQDYLYYVLRSESVQTFWTAKANSGGAVSNLNSDIIRKTLIPIPSMAEQKSIASILDRFDTLTNDLTQGLPAEIEKRRQQYEYYRDKLLTFKRKAA